MSYANKVYNAPVPIVVCGPTNRSDIEMSSSPPTTETYEVDLSRDEQWVVHDVVARRVDDAIDDENTPPTWALEVVETIESDGNTFTREQVNRTYEIVTSYIETSETPDSEVNTGESVLDQFEGSLPQLANE